MPFVRNPTFTVKPFPPGKSAVAGFAVSMTGGDTVPATSGVPNVTTPADVPSRPRPLDGSDDTDAAMSEACATKSFVDWSTPGDVTAATLPDPAGTALAGCSRKS